MRKLLLCVLFISLNQAAELELGSLMPGTDHKMRDISGNDITLDDIKGEKGTIVIFSCNTCPWVIRWEDRYVTIAESYIPKGVGMLAVNSNASRFKGDDSLGNMIIHAKEKKYNFPYAQDPNSELAMLFGATKTPHVYLFDKSNRLVYRGAIDDNARDSRLVDEPFLANAINNIIEDKPVEKPVSKAIGCSIKFP
ncbi:MAG: thioredoxin family protein [Candidatus Neomarinimicrobiota bacterium]